MPPINSTVTRNMVEYLKYIGVFYQYETNDIKKINFIIKNFKIELKENNSITFTINSKINRKLKLISIVDNKIKEHIDEIIKNSKRVNTTEFLEKKISLELAAEINKQIIKDLKKHFKIK